MARINLLPWRDEYRQEKKKQFFLALMVVCLIAAAVSFGWVSWVNAAIKNQDVRNAKYTAAIKKLDDDIKEIAMLEQAKTAALARLDVIQNLESKRYNIVAYFDEMVDAVPTGVFLKKMARDGQVLNLEGVASSRKVVAEFMRQLDESIWYKNSGLKKMVLEEKYGLGAYSFELTVELDDPNELKEDS